MPSKLNKLNFLITRRQRLGLVLLAVLLLLGMSMEVFGLGIILPAIALILDPDIINKNKYFGFIYDYLKLDSHLEFVFYFLGFVLLIYFIKTLFLIFLTYKQNRFLNNINAYVSNLLFEKYLKAPYNFHLLRDSTSLVKNLQVEVIYFQVYCLALLTIVIESGLVIAVISTLILIEPTGAISVGLFFGFLSYMFYSIFKVKLNEWGSNREQLDEQISKIAIESLSVIKEINVSGKKNFFINSFSKLNYNKSRISSNHSTISQLPRFYLELVSILGLVGFIFIMLIKGENPNSLITILGVFVAATFRLIPSLNRILTGFQNLKYYNKSIDLLYSEIQINNLVIEEEIFDFDFKNEIYFKNISFKYKFESDLIFNSLSFKIKKGETIGLIGNSGSGKSTFVDILIGLLKPTSGQILVDGKDINKSISSWQKKIGYFSQDIRLINDSILNNIALGVEKDEINLDSIKKCLEYSQLNTFIKQLPNGINTKVGDKGVQISGGQKQRIGLARALYYNPEILILDEATSALDNSTENEVMKAIELLNHNKTIIIIAHRHSTLSFCDKIFELKNSSFSQVIK